jgi:ABC-type arginine transport system permease subunit
LLFILLLRGLGLLVLLVLLFFRLQHALEDLLELAESIGSCLRQAFSGCDRER